MCRGGKFRDGQILVQRSDYSRKSSVVYKCQPGLSTVVTKVATHPSALDM